jgi:hypothetical protein
VLLSLVPFILVQTGVYTFLGEFGRVARHLSIEAALHVVGIPVDANNLLIGLHLYVWKIIDIRMTLFSRRSER